jgi:hypothetical protein
MLVMGQLMLDRIVVRMPAPPATFNLSLGTNSSDE